MQLRACGGVIAALVCVTGTAARADSETDALFSLPLVLGATTQGDNGFVIGARPELVIARLTALADEPDVKVGPGVGVYGELLRANGTTLAGGGLSYVGYRASGGNVTPSLGLYHRYTGTAIPDNGVTASVFLGWRRESSFTSIFDFPSGLRIEGRFGFDGDEERSIIIAVQLDLMLPAAFIGSLIQAKRSGSLFGLPR